VNETGMTEMTQPEGAGLVGGALLRGAIFGMALALLGIIAILLISIDKGLPPNGLLPFLATSACGFALGFTATPIALLERLAAPWRRSLSRDLRVGLAAWFLGWLASLLCVFQIVYAAGVMRQGSLDDGFRSCAAYLGELGRAPRFFALGFSVLAAPFAPAVVSRLRAKRLWGQVRAGAVATPALAFAPLLAMCANARFEWDLFLWGAGSAVFVGAALPVAAAIADALERRVRARFVDAPT
jgi:hypothetical protein